MKKRIFTAALALMLLLFTAAMIPAVVIAENVLPECPEVYVGSDKLVENLYYTWENGKLVGKNEKPADGTEYAHLYPSEKQWVLELNNFVYSGAGHYFTDIAGQRRGGAVAVKGNIKVFLMGKNSLTSTDTYTDMDRDTEDSYFGTAGLFVLDGDLLISAEKGGTLTATGSSDSGWYISSGIDCRYIDNSAKGGNIKIEGGKINANGGNANRFSRGINSLGTLTISGGDVTATAMSAGNSFGISSTSAARASIIISGSANVTATGGIPKQNGDSAGIHTERDVTITTTGKVVGKSNDSKGYGLSVTPVGELSEGEKVPAVSLSGMNIELEGSKIHEKATISYGSDDNRDFNAYEKADDGTYIKVIDLFTHEKDFIIAEAYPVWVGNVQVLSIFANDIQVSGANGSASYDPQSKTLTLNSFKYAGSGSSGDYVDVERFGAIRADQDLTIHLIGENKLTCSGVVFKEHKTEGKAVTKFAQSAIMLQQNHLTITAAEGASLDAETDNRDNAYVNAGIHANSIKIEGGKITATGGIAGDHSRGINAFRAIEICGGDITAVAGDATNKNSYALATLNNSSDSSITIFGNANVHAYVNGPTHKDNAGIYCDGSVTINTTGIVKASGSDLKKADNTSRLSAGIANNHTYAGSVCIKNGTVVAASGTTGGNGDDLYGIRAGEQFAIEGGSTVVTATGNTQSVFVKGNKFSVGSSFAVFVGTDEASASQLESGKYNSADSYTKDYAHFVNVCDLTITTTGLDEDRSCIFTITNSENVTLLTVVVVGNDSVTIKGLPYGDYTVTEQNGWSWRDDNTYSQTAKPTDAKLTFAFTVAENGTYNNQWLDDEDHFPGKVGENDE